MEEKIKKIIDILKGSTVEDSINVLRKVEKELSKLAIV